MLSQYHARVAYHENDLTKGNHNNSLCSSYVKSRYAKVVKCVTLQHPVKHLLIIFKSLKKFQCSDWTNWVSESAMYWLPLQQCLCVIRHVAWLIRMCLWAVCYSVKTLHPIVKMKCELSSARVTDKQILGEIAEDHLIWFKVPTGAVYSKSIEFENFTSRWGLFTVAKANEGSNMYNNTGWLQFYSTYKIGRIGIVMLRNQ